MGRINMLEDERAEDIPVEGLFTHLRSRRTILTTVLSREDKPECGHVVLEWLDLFCHDCGEELDPDDYGVHAITVLARMRREYFSTRCPECHQSHIRREMNTRDLDVPDIGSPGEEVSM